MPYIPKESRNILDGPIREVVDELVSAIKEADHTAEISEHYRSLFVNLAKLISGTVTNANGMSGKSSATARLAEAIVGAAAKYNQIGAWAGEMNYAVTLLIQLIPYKLKKLGVWTDYLRYWLHAQTVGAISRTVLELDRELPDGYVANGLVGVFVDVKDELKRRVNVPYEAAEIQRSGDCYHFSPFHTKLVSTSISGVDGYLELLLPWHEPEGEPT